MSTWTLPSVPPHDWFISLDVDAYFDHEHDPEIIFEEGFTRPIPVGDRDVVITSFFNGEVDSPEFHMESAEPLDKAGIAEANQSLARIFGTELDLRPLYDRAADDPVLGPKLTEFYGLKRMARANLFEDTLNRIVEMRLSHKPTAKKMVYRIRENYGTMLQYRGRSYPAWPRPHQLIKASPMSIRKLGPTKRKGEYIIGFAEDLLSGEQEMKQLENCEPGEFYERISEVRGVGPTSAQQLMLFRERTDAVFPSRKKKGEEKGLRRWIILSYGGDPADTGEEEFGEMIANWEGYEAAALEFLYVNYIMGEKRKGSS
ncbi:MAG: hypothetical protein U5K31_05510 [Balneolaceae bacterium]|nr:hypothetical protein [Balneolaceae bacterium]